MYFKFYWDNLILETILESQDTIIYRYLLSYFNYLLTYKYVLINYRLQVYLYLLSKIYTAA